MAITDFNDPVIINWYTDGEGSKISLNRQNQTYVVLNNKIILSEIPDMFYKINTITVGATTLYESRIGTLVNTTNFSVNYALGEITVDSSYNGQTITIPSWYARGIIYYPSSRIYNNVDASGNVTQTLGDLLAFAKIEYQEPVATFANIVTTYPSPLVGYAVQCEDNGKFYRWNGTSWQYFQILNSTQLGELLSDMGDIADLDTTDKTSVINAINETVNKISLLSGVGGTVEKANKSDFDAHKADTAQIYINVFAPPVPLVAVKGDGTDDSVAINAIIQYAKSVNGACIVFPPANYGIASTIVIDGSNINLTGFGMGDIHDATGNIAATRFTWIGAANGTMMELCPHATSLTRIDSCQVSNISFIANDLADYGLVIKSVNNSKFEMLYFNEFGVAGLYVGVDITGAITEASDSQKNIFSMITGKQRIKDGAVLFLTGGTSVAGKKGNTSYNYFESIQGGIHNGNGITVDDADNNYFTQTRFHVLDNTSTGIGIELRGRNDLISSGAAGNFFMHVGISNKTLAYSIIARGTESYTYPSRENTVLYIDKGNGTKDPVIETDAVLTWSTSLGYQNKFKLKSTVFAASDAGILAALAALTTEPIMICGSNTHIGLLAADSSSKWNINIETATGDLRMTRQTGTGKVSVPALKYAGLDVSVGANDSGGTGYRILRIPNA